VILLTKKGGTVFSLFDDDTPLSNRDINTSSLANQSNTQNDPSPMLSYGSTPTNTDEKQTIKSKTVVDKDTIERNFDKITPAQLNISQSIAKGRKSIHSLSSSTSKSEFDNPLLDKSASQLSIIPNDVQSDKSTSSESPYCKSVNRYYHLLTPLFTGFMGLIGGHLFNHELQYTLIGFGVGLFMLTVYLVYKLQEVIRNSSNDKPPALFFHYLFALFLFLGGLTGLIVGQLTHSLPLNHVLTGLGVGFFLLLTIRLVCTIDKVHKASTHCSCLDELDETVTKDDELMSTTSSQSSLT